jgi:hypothetical protein
LRGRVIDAGDPCAAGLRDLRNHFAESAERAGDDNDFSLHDALRRLNLPRLLRGPNWSCNGGGFKAE